jgi:hypothetical protein
MQYYSCNIPAPGNLDKLITAVASGNNFTHEFFVLEMLSKVGLILNLEIPRVLGGVQSPTLVLGICVIMMLCEMFSLPQFILLPLSFCLFEFTHFSFSRSAEEQTTDKMKAVLCI